MQRHLLTTARLAAKGGIRQVEVLDHADRIGVAVERETRRHWRELLALLSNANPVQYAANYAAALALLQRLQAATLTTLRQQLARLARDAKRSAGRILSTTIPLAHLRAASPVPAELVRESWLREDFARTPGGLVVFRPDGTIADRGAPLREPTRSGLSEEEERRIFWDLLFPPPTEERINRILTGILPAPDWLATVGDRDRQTAESLAGMIARGLSQGLTQQQLARDIAPLFDGNMNRAKRSARTFGLYVAQQMQEDSDDELGDMVIGWQIHATLDQWTRSWHSARDGTIYYKNPSPGQKGLRQMPHPPMEPDDPAERPPGTPKIAWHCRCYTSPVLSAPSSITRDPARMAVLQTHAGNVIPDPSTYSDWFAAASERQRKLAVGTRRYTTVAGQLDRPPDWKHFLDPSTGRLLTVDELRHESPDDRAARLQKVEALLRDRAALANQVRTYGFVLPDAPPPTGASMSVGTRPPDSRLERLRRQRDEKRRQREAKRQRTTSTI